MNFSDFNLNPDLLEGIDALNFTTPTPVQEQAIPLILNKKDIIGVAQTGTGKTAAFILPILHMILESQEGHYTQALVVVPTRELAMQIDHVIEAYSYFTNVSSCAIYGGSDGKSFAREKTALTSGADIVIATPGRLIAHINLGYVDFSHLRFLVLDEADRMLDMGFKPDLLKIIATVNPQRQNLLFSATMPADVLRFARSLVHDPVMVSIAVSKPAEGVQQTAYVVDAEQKLPLIVNLLQKMKDQRVLVFGSTRLSVNALYQQLRGRKIPVARISSDVEQTEREQVMLDFRNGKTNILIATDVLSRGIDVEGIDAVVNYDVPRDPEDYVHRIGRTARAARTGLAITLVSPADRRRFVRIETFVGQGKIEKQALPEQGGGSKPAAAAKPAGMAKPAGAAKPAGGDGAPAPDKTGEKKPAAAGKKRRSRRRGRKRPENAGKPGTE